MKKINVIYNHNIFDAPYKQSVAKKTEGEIKNLFGDDLQVCVTHTSHESPNPFDFDSDLIIAEHSFDMTSEEKAAFAAVLNKSVTKLKSAEPIDVVVSLRRISEDDLYVFEAGADN